MSTVTRLVPKQDTPNVQPLEMPARLAQITTRLTELAAGLVWFDIDQPDECCDEHNTFYGDEVYDVAADDARSAATSAWTDALVTREEEDHLAWIAAARMCGVVFLEQPAFTGQNKEAQEWLTAAGDPDETKLVDELTKQIHEARWATRIPEDVAAIGWVAARSREAYNDDVLIRLEVAARQSQQFDDVYVRPLTRGQAHSLALRAVTA